jgi:hypothetical protein
VNLISSASNITTESLGISRWICRTTHPNLQKVISYLGCLIHWIESCRNFS